MKLNSLLELLQSGDLRSDGHADEVSSEVIQNPEIFGLLLDGLEEEEDVVRGRTAHALEKVSRKHPELFEGLLNQLLKQAVEDELPMVRWHLAMLFMNLELTFEQTIKVISTLYALLDDESVFVKSWAISGLTILAKDNPDEEKDITSKIKAFKDHKSAAVRNRVSKALKVLEMGGKLPQGWSKRDI